MKYHIENGQTSTGIKLEFHDAMSISSGGVANSTTVYSDGRMYINSGGVANSTTVYSDGRMYISSGGVANSTVNSGGSMNISSGGVANSTTVNNAGFMNISSGGVANSTTVNSGGSITISSGGVHCGSLNVRSGADVSVDEGGVIDFTVADRSSKDGYLINNLSLITGTPTYTVTVDDDQTYGTYKLAQGAENFTGSVTIGNGKVEYGSVTVNGDVFSYGGTAYTLTEKGGNLNLVVSNDKYIFISSKYNDKIDGKIQDGVLLEYGRNAFTSIDDVDYSGNKTIILLDGKNSGDYSDRGTVAGTVLEPVIKKTDNSYSYKANSAPKGTLNLVADTGSTEFIRFATVNVTGATVGNVTGGKESSTEDTKTAVDKKGAVTYTEKNNDTKNATGKFTALDGSAATVKGYATVNLTSTTVTAELAGGNTKETSNSKLVDGGTKDQKTISTVNDSVAAGSVTLKNQADADTIRGYSNVTLTDSTVGDITNFTSKDSKSESATYDEAKNAVSRKVTLSHTENTAGTFKATDSEKIGNVTGFVTVTLKNVEQSGDFCRKDADGDDYSTVKKTLNIKTNKDGSVTGTYNKTENFTRAGKFTATDSKVGNVENFSTVILDGSGAGEISNFMTSKIVTKGTAFWDNMTAYGRPEDYNIDLSDWILTETITESLNGSVTLKNGASATSISDFKSVSLTGSEVEKIDNVNKVTVNKGDSFIGSYIGTEANDTLTIAKGAVLTANQIDLGEEVKDTLAINGTLILTSSEDDLPFVNAAKITGKGEIAAVSTIYKTLNINHTNILDVGDTAQNFRGTAYENSDDNFKKAVKWDGKEEYNGWLGSWEGYTDGSDMVDHIKFKAAAGDILEICDAITDETLNDQYWVLLDKKGNEIDSTDIFDTDGRFMTSGEYIIKVETEKNLAYSITLA